MPFSERCGSQRPAPRLRSATSALRKSGLDSSRSGGGSSAETLAPPAGGPGTSRDASHTPPTRTGTRTLDCFMNKA